jgi:hypothetical protein
MRLEGWPRATVVQAAILRDASLGPAGEGLLLRMRSESLETTDGGSKAPPAIWSEATRVRCTQSHLAPAMPPLIQSSALTPGGGLTHSAGKYWMSTTSTRFRSGLYLVRPKAIG